MKAIILALALASASAHSQSFYDPPERKDYTIEFRQGYSDRETNARLNARQSYQLDESHRETERAANAVLDRANRSQDSRAYQYGYRY